MNLPDKCPFCGAGVLVLENGKEDRSRNYVKFECHTYIQLHIKDPCNQSPTCKDAKRARLAARVAELEARCKRLEEAGDAMASAADKYGIPYHSHYPEIWRAAKEAKP